MKRFSRILCIILTVLAISCQKEKEPEIVKVTGVTLNSTSLTLTEGESQTLSATVSPQDAANKKVFWSTSNASVASVDNGGKVTASAAGSATITVTTDDGGKTATCKVTVKAPLPSGALPGEFSVSDTKKVHFSQGNLWYDGFEFMFEENQYDFANQWKSNHISHFNWTPYAGSAVLRNFSGYGNPSDIFFTNADETTASEVFIVNVDGKEQKGWRTLSKAEWKYLFDVRKVKGNRGIEYSYSINITYGDNIGLVLYPDDYSGSALTPSTQYTKETFPKGCVFLPAAGYRDYNIEAVGSYGLYQSSSASTSFDAYCVSFLGDTVKPDDSTGFRSFGYCVRLVTECR